MIPQLVKSKAPAATVEGPPDPEAILERLEKAISGGVTLGRASQGSGVPVYQLAEMLESKTRTIIGAPDKWGNDTKGTRDLRALAAWLDECEAIRHAESLEQIATPTRALIEGIARRALQKKRLVVIVGSYGIGKSSTLEWFAHANPMTRATPGAVYVPFTKDDKSPTAVYEKLNEAMRLDRATSTHSRSLGTRVRDALRAGDVLLCDNANYLLQANSINVLADIHDRTQASLVVAANPVYSHLTKSADDNADAFFNRAEVVRIDRSTEGDVDAVLLARGLSGETLRSDAVKIGTRPGREGGLRALLKVIERSEERAAQVGHVVNAKVFRQSARELGLL